MLRSLTRAVIVAVVAATAVVGCGSEYDQRAVAKATVATPEETPDAFLSRLLKYSVSGQFDREYDALHPALQKLISRREFASCWEEIGTPLPSGVALRSVDIVEMRDDTFSTVGITRAPAKTVTWVARYDYTGDFSDGQPTFDFQQIDYGRGFTKRSTGTLLAVDGEWRWVVGYEFARLLKSGRCARDVSSQ